jgi:hypothetical protein
MSCRDCDSIAAPLQSVKIVISPYQTSQDSPERHGSDQRDSIASGDVNRGLEPFSEDPDACTFLTCDLGESLIY